MTGDAIRFRVLAVLVGVMWMDGTIPAAQVAGRDRAPAALARQDAPSTLMEAIRSVPRARLLDPARDLEKEYTTAVLREAGYWPAWIQHDFTRDGREDIAAVVVRPSETGPQFAVIAVHDNDGQDIAWIVPFQSQPVYSIAQRRPAALNVLFCVHCDWDLWFRWNGSSYEEYLHAVGEHVVVVDPDAPGSSAPLFRGPSMKEARLATVPACTDAVVRQVSGGPGARWYEVDIPTMGRRGWIPATLADVNACMG